MAHTETTVFTVVFLFLGMSVLLRYTSQNRRALHYIFCACLAKGCRFNPSCKNPSIELKFSFIENYFYFITFEIKLTNSTHENHITFKNK